MKVVAVVQARCASTRLPNKVMMDLLGKEVILHVVDRVKQSKNIDEIVVATTTDEIDDKLCTLLSKNNINYFRGSAHNVLDRYFQCVNEIANVDYVVRITADCPLIDYQIIDKLIDEVSLNNHAYASNTIKETYPDGLDAEVFSFDMLSRAYENATSEFDLEHVTPYMKRIEKETFCLESEIDSSNIRITLDEDKDFYTLEGILKLNEKLQTELLFEDIIYIFKNYKNVFNNRHIKRNEGALMSDGVKLWKRAKKTIPGGNMLLSKRSEMFLPNAWPSYFEKTDQKYVYDLNGNKFLDMSIMGIGTNTLGYNDPDVDKAVLGIVKKGNMSTFNCPEEVTFLEDLISLHPWSSMGKLTRSGGEANAVAIRIARAASGKDVVAFCGYHGWHDWYLASNLNNKDSLNEHLLTGLSTIGVPKNLQGSTLPFRYNNIESLKEIVSKNAVGVIKMEVMRNYEPEDNFLEAVRAIANENNIVLIFDECTSGFRETMGGLHLKYKVEPDIAIFGKAIGNGYALNAIIGKEEVMNYAQESFISSTFWTERIGPTAGIATLKKMSKLNSPSYITDIGSKFKKMLLRTAKKYKLEIEVFGLDALATFVFKSKNNLIYKTFLTQEFLKKGVLASNTFYASTAHDDDDIKAYETILEEVFFKLQKAEQGEINIESLLESNVCHSSFERLN